MTFLKNRDPEVLPGADQDADCQTAPETVKVPLAGEEDEEDEHEHEVTWDALDGRETTVGHSIHDWQRKQSGWAHALERIALAIEKPVSKLIGNGRLNPLYHTGPLAIFLLMIVGGTGFYLFLFFHYGFDASYEAVTQYDQQFIARTMRAVHRYASGALVITTLLHAYRTLFMERFRGPRWLAWVTGIVLTAIIWLAGVTGYWLVWDVRAQLINESFIRFLQRFTPWASPYAAKIAEVEISGESWPILLLILGVHVLLFLIAAGFFWLHVRRLKRAKWFPEMHWMVGVVLLLLASGIAFPLTILPQADLSQLPQGINLDPIFLFFIPAAGRPTAVLLWSVLIGVTVIALALPWLTRDKSANLQTTAPELPKVNIIKDRCTGCTKCALDCPYGAIQMVERHDDKPHKFIAIEDPALCVSCGICVGSCDGVAVSLGNTPPALLWDEVAMRLSFARARTVEQPVKLVFTCDRHAAHGAKPFLGKDPQNESAIEVVALPCVGTLPPDLLVKALASGADEVHIVGCPPDDCRNREGNLWTAQRLMRQRVPRLKRTYANAPITAVWEAPNNFAQALQTKPVLKLDETGQPKPDYMASRRLFQKMTWRNVVAAFLFLAVVLIAQIFLTDIWSKTPATENPRIQLTLSTPTTLLSPESFVTNDSIYRLVLAVDDQILQDSVLTRADVIEADPLFFELPVEPGLHEVHLYLGRDNGRGRIPLYQQQVNLSAGEVLRLQQELFNTSDCLPGHCLD